MQRIATTAVQLAICKNLDRIARLALIWFGFLATGYPQNFVPPTGSPLAQKIHPRIFVTAAEVPVLRSRVLDHSRDEFQAYVTALDRVYDESPASKSSNLLLMDAQNYAFLYLLDPKEMGGVGFGRARDDYGRRAIEHALVAAKMDRGDSHSSAKPQSSDGAYHNLAIAVVYDWVNPLLSQEEKKLLAEGLIHLYEIRDEDADPGVKQKLSNKISGYVHHGSAGALALWGDELGAPYQQKAQEMLNFFHDVFLERMLATGDRIFQGPGWSEGASYYFLGITNVHFLAAAASSALGVDLIFETDFLRHNPLYILYNALPLKLRGSHYLSRHDTNSLQPLGDQDLSRVMALSAGILRASDPEMSGLAKWMLTEGGMAIDIEEYRYYDPRIDDLFFRFFWGSQDVRPVSPEEINLPLSTGLGLGEIVMKSSFDMERSTHIIFWAPEYWYSPHAHKDLASFTIYKHGSMALDAGNGKNADDMPRGDSFSEAVFHNILGLYDPEQNDDGFNFMDFDFSPESSADHWQDSEFQQDGRNHVGDLIGFETAAGFTLVDYDYTRAYDANRCSSARRRFIYLPGNENEEFVIIHDVVQSPQEKRFLLHTAFEPEIDGDLITVTNEYDRAHGQMLVHAVLPADKQILKVGGEGNWFVDADWKVIDSRGPYVDWGAYWTGSYRFEIRSDESEFLTVMQIGDLESLQTVQASVVPVMASNFSGVLIGDRHLVMLGEPSRQRQRAKYTITAEREVQHLVAGLVPNAAVTVFKNGAQILQLTTGRSGVTSFKDNPLGISTYKVVIGQQLSVKSDAAAMPDNFRLSQNHPNPFNPVTVDLNHMQGRTLIEYHLNQSGFVSMQVFDISGRLVRTLVTQDQTPGVYQVSWDGMTDGGSPAPAGVYFYRLTSLYFAATKKLILIR